jgi:hypothetical protein
MSIGTLTKNNQNQYRRYPIKQGGLFQSTDGFIVSDAAIVNCRVTTIFGKHRLYIKQIFNKNGIIKITLATISSVAEDNDVAIGVFSGELTDDFITLPLTPFLPYVSGTITLGSISTLKALSRIIFFTKENTELEESTIFCYTRPKVTSIQDNQKNKITGHVNFGTLTNVVKTTNYAAGGVQLAVQTPASVFNPADKSSALGNCDKPAIKNINGVLPSPENKDAKAANDGNIYIVGVKPLLFYGTASLNSPPYTPGVLSVETTGVTLSSLCAQKTVLLPPVNIGGFTLDTPEYRDKYYSKPALTKHVEEGYPSIIPSRRASNFNSTSRPEYYYWPQFVKEEYYAYWPLIAPSVPDILQASIASGKLTVVFKAPTTGGNSAIANYQYSLDGGTTYITRTVDSDNPRLTDSPLIVSAVSPVNFTLRAVNTSGEVGAATAPLRIS